MNDSTRWIDTVQRAAATLAAPSNGSESLPSENSATPIATPPAAECWSAHDVWLSRIKQPRDLSFARVRARKATQRPFMAAAHHR